MRAKKIKKIGLASKYETAKVRDAATKIINYLNGKAKVYCLPDLAAKIEYKKTFDIKKPKVDAIISIGGDGTMLKTIRDLGGAKVPVVGLMRGRIGFLTEISNNMYKSLDKLLAGHYKIDARSKLSVKINDKYIGDVLNEVVITTSTPAKMQRFVLDVHGDRIDEIDADGLIVSTPTGSTAYAMSAGGPIIDPWVNAYEIVPMAPLRLSARAIVVPRKAETVIQTITRRKSLIVLDGYYGPSITDKDKVIVTQSKNKAHLISFKKDFFQKVRQKLS